ncbi:AP-4 complex accessory subunit Tepsin-like [Babylonia areolata]|uniref:AP-4 complex accessory subunit Tepsin-like n=1 Tax=Babylonia areolata TaxID=304850 RepID=UPI003FD12DBF
MAQLEKNSSGDYAPPVVAPQPPALVKKVPSAKKVVPKSYAPGRAGGGWDSADHTTHNQSSGSEGSCDSSDRLETVSVTDWSAEEQLVMEHLLLDNTTQFILLRPSQLKVFKQKCQNLNCEKVVDFINERLQSTEDYVVVRALLLMETFLFRNDAVSLDYIVTVCQNQLNHLVHSSSDQRIADKAEKIIRILETYSGHATILVPSDQSN